MLDVITLNYFLIKNFSVFALFPFPFFNTTSLTTLIHNMTMKAILMKNDTNDKRKILFKLDLFNLIRSYKSLVLTCLW